MGRVCWFVRSSFVVISRSSKSKSPIFMKCGTYVQRLCQTSLLTFDRSRSMFKVKTAVLKLFY